MSEPFIAEIRLMPYSFAPKYWAFCDGQTVQIAQNSMLYAVIGTTYGGNGTTTFMLPNLQGRIPIHPGRGPGLTYRYLGERGGGPAVSLDVSQMPSHNHDMVVTKEAGTTNNPAGLYPAKHMDPLKGKIYKEDPALDSHFALPAVANTGQGVAHENRQPYLTIPFCIALDGLFPQRS